MLNKSRNILIVWSILFAASLTGIFMLKRNVSVSSYFKSSHPVSIADRIMDQKFGGSKPLFVVFKGDMQSPEVLKGMLDMEGYMKKSPYISNTQSIADVVTKMNKAMDGKNTIPDDEAMIRQLWFLLDQQESLKQFVTENLDEGIIIAKFKDQGLLQICLFCDHSRQTNLLKLLKKKRVLHPTR